MLGNVKPLSLENHHHEQHKKNRHSKYRKVQYKNGISVYVERFGKQSVRKRYPDNARYQVEGVKYVLFLAGGEVKQAVVEHQRHHHSYQQCDVERSEERRVGKEGRSRLV